MKKLMLATTALTAVAALLLATACNKTKGKERFGGAIDPSAPTVTLAQLIAKPEAYDGQNVIVDGQFAGACGDGDFYFKDKLDMIEADPPSPEVCTRLKKGTPVRLYGLVKARRSGGGEAAGASAREPGEVHVKIVAKAVEVI